MTRLSGTHECATMGCRYMVRGNTRWCEECRAQISTPTFTRSDTPLMDEIAEARALLATWDTVSARRSGRGSPWWWR